MEQIIEYGTYQQYKQELDTELRKTTEGFVRIGYLLKVAKDTDILKESGYANVYDFAQAEYNIDKSQVSRFMNINDRFSEGGYSDRLKEQFQGFGHAKLTIMLQLPDEINEELTPEFTKSEIQALKEEYDEERQVSDIEVLLEGEDKQQQEMDCNLYKVLHQLGKEEPELYVKLFMTGSAMESGDMVVVQEVLAPDGEKIYSIRIMGVGRFMMSVKGIDKPITLTNVRTAEKEEYSWEVAILFLQKLMRPGEAPAESWENTYGEKYPVKEEPQKTEIAPVQPNSQKKPVPKKETKVQKAKKPAPVKEEPTKDPEPEEQIPGQDNVMNHPEYLPESMKLQNDSIDSTETILENVTEDAEIVDALPECVDFTKSEEDSDSPAAGIEEEDDLEKIWNRAEAAEMGLSMFFDEYDDEDARKTPEFKKELRKAYQIAIAVAADLERIINHG